MNDHDCPHCAEARAIAEELRTLLPEAHAIIAQLRKLAPRDGSHVDLEPHDAPSVPTTHRFHNGG